MIETSISVVLSPCEIGLAGINISDKGSFIHSLIMIKTTNYCSLLFFSAQVSHIRSNKSENGSFFQVINEGSEDTDKLNSTTFSGSVSLLTDCVHYLLTV